MSTLSSFSASDKVSCHMLGFNAGSFWRWVGRPGEMYPTVVHTSTGTLAPSLRFEPDDFEIFWLLSIVTWISSNGQFGGSTGEQAKLCKVVYEPAGSHEPISEAHILDFVAAYWVRFRKKAKGVTTFKLRAYRICSMQCTRALIFFVPTFISHTSTSS